MTLVRQYRRWTRQWTWTKNQGAERRLEIGPGWTRIPGFETLDIFGRWNVDYLADASKTLPFPNETFGIIYASHVLEHIPWYMVPEVLKDWVRCLEPGGRLEIWVPNGLEICRAFVAAEESSDDSWLRNDGWLKFNPDKDPCLWASGRIFSYGAGTADGHHPNWHRAVFSPRYLLKLLQEAGLEDVRLLEPGQERAYSHGWINLGATGTKP